MKTLRNILYFVLCTFVLTLVSCEPKALTEKDVILQPENIDSFTADGKIINIHTLLDTYMTEKGNFLSDSTPYRQRAIYGDKYLFSIDTLPVGGPAIYIRGRVGTDDYGGNFYKSIVLQQVNDWENNGASIDQQCLRVSLDIGSANGLYHIGQEIIIRCNGLAIGRYANQPQLCVPSNNNNIYASSAEEKTGWAPGRIPSAMFRKATRLIGTPDKSKLVYETMTMAELQTKYQSKYNDVVGARKLDGRLVKITGAHFSGEYDELNVGPAPCNRYKGDSTETGNPTLDKNACTFGPTTGNVGYPQSRYIKDASNQNKALVSTSEYARYANYYLPSAKYEGSIIGVLGYYMDNGKYAPDGGEWSITPYDMTCILPEAQEPVLGGDYWIPVEWTMGVPQPED